MGAPLDIKSKDHLDLGRLRASAIAVDSFGNPHVVWQDDTPGNREIYYRKFIK